MKKAIILFNIISWCATTGVLAARPLQGEVEINAASKLESNAGLWLDGQYVGSVSELDGKGRLALVPGEHQLLFKLIGHEDVTSTIVVEPGTRQQYRLAMSAVAGAIYPKKWETAQLRIDVKPKTQRSSSTTRSSAGPTVSATARHAFVGWHLSRDDRIAGLRGFQRRIDVANRPNVRDQDRAREGSLGRTSSGTDSTGAR